MCDAMRLHPLLFPRSLAIVGASPRNVEAVVTACGGDDPGLGRQPEPRRGRRAPVLPDRSPSSRRLPRRRCCSSTTSASRQAFEDASPPGVRAFVVPGRRRRGGQPSEADVIDRSRRGLVRSARLMIGPNCMGAVVPDGHTSMWIGRPPDDHRRRARRRPRQSGSIADAFISLGGRVGFRYVISSGAEAATDAADYLSSLRRGRGNARGRALPRDGARARAFVDGARRLRRGGEAGRVPQGRPLGGGRAGGALPHGRARRLGPGVLCRAPPPRRDRGRRLPRARRDARDPRSPPLAGGHAHRRRSPSRAGSARLLADQAEAAGVPFEPLSADAPRAAPGAEFPNYLDPGNPLDSWAVARREEIYPGSLELLASFG